ncbi:MAG: SCO family protein [Pseudomonadota bacterium]|nr:SCO family protein [Pseudomonadota bacterium]|tara:strand:+ start:201 stop:782 length:582 start_codon:yes stop_codon:yes gene_type:complete
MNKSYILYGIAFILLVGIFLNDEPKVKTNYTKLHSESMFLEDNVRVESTKSKIFDNKSLKNKITLVFFGYTSCPDFCPDTLARANNIFKRLDNSNIQLLFVSIDPKDDLDVIKKYVEYFNKDFIGVSINDKNIKKLVKKTGVYAKKVSSTGSIDFYDHTGAIFLINRDSKVMGLYTPPIKDELIISDLKRITN